MAMRTRFSSPRHVPGWFSRARRRPRRAVVCLLLVTLVAATAPLLAPAQTVAAVSADVATTDPTNGFPLWYQDTGGTRLAPCLDPADASCVVAGDATYDPARPQLFPSNFPSEFFYALADSQKIPTNGCSGTKRGTVSVRLALEGAFTGGSPVPGQQMTFGRVRLNVTGGLCANSSYTATYPFGQISFTTDGNGALAKNQGTTDVGCAPVAPATCDFRLALSSPVVKNFLRWDASAPVAPTGYLGDAVTAHRITGASYVAPGESSPANYFRISGPKLSTPLQTNLFTVSGKIAGPLSSDPASLDFGGQDAGTQSGARQLTVTNIGDSTITPKAASVSGADASSFAVTDDKCVGVPLARDATCQLAVRFEPATAGVRTASLQVGHSGVGPTLGVRLAGTGKASSDVARASVTPSSLDYGNQRLGVQSPDRDVAVTNTGTAPLEVSSATLTGSDSGEFAVSFDGCTAHPVAPGASCKVSLAFSPTRVQASSARLAIASNDPAGPSLVDLSGTGFGGVAKVSPTASGFDGFPDWYQDEKGIRLAQCIDPTDPNCVVLPGGTFAGQAPLSFPDNFPDEFFYSVVDSDIIQTPGCQGSAPGKAMIRMGVEGAFSGAEPTAGDQITFGRIRINATSGLCPGTAYTFVHPYGVDTFTADASGMIKRTAGTEDVGCLVATAANPCDFGAAVRSRVLGGFLQWDSANGPAAPAGYLGDSQTLHRVVGSQFVPAGQSAPANYFKIYQGGTLIGQTDMFTVMGKLAGPLVADPPSHSFGSVGEGQRATQRVTLRNEGVDPLKVNTLGLVGPDVGDFALDTAADECTGTTLVPTASCTAEVGFSPSAVGDRTATLRVDHTGLNNPMSVSLTGVGLAGSGQAAMSADATALGFEQLLVGRPSTPQTLRVSNKGGTAPLTVDPPSLTGADSTDFRIVENTCTTEVPVDGTCSIKLGHTPAASGPRHAVLQVTSPNAKPASLTIDLSGQGFSGAPRVADQQRPDDAFPAWYQDGNGVRLQPCLDVGDPRCVVLGGPGFDPGQPMSFPGNYPPEFFYALADSEPVATPGCEGTSPGTAMLRLALEGSFANGVAETGQQTTFGRIRFNVSSGLCPNTVYTFTTPYGPLTATTNDLGGVARNVGTTDVGCGAAPCNFADALASRNLGGFVRWAPGVGAAAPTGYLGDGVSFHPIVGGTFAVEGEPVNYFDITGPDGSSVARTAKFMVSGKLSSGMLGTPVSYGDRPTGSSTTRTVTFSNTGSTPASISGADVVGSGAAAFSATGGSCAGATVTTDATCTVEVSFTPSSAQVYAAAVRVLGGNGAVLGTANLTGHGVLSGGPRAVVDPTSLTFAPQRVGTSSPASTVTVRNTGTAPLNVLPPTFAGLASADYRATVGTGCASVPAAGSCVISVVFTPAATGSRTATMTVPSNDPGTAPTVAVAGTGTSSVISLKSNTLDLGKVRAGRTATKQLTLTNTGSAPLNITGTTLDNPTSFSVALGTCAVAVAPGRSCSISVSLRPQATAGTYIGSVGFVSDASNNPALRVTATVN